MKQARSIARKLKRSEAAVRQKLSINGVKSKVRFPKDYSLHRISRLLGVSDSIVRAWFRKGLFGDPNGQGKRKACARSSVRISSEAVEAFCREHPEKINPDECDPQVLDWLEEKKRQPAAWRGLRQHLAERKSRPSCGRVIPGNGYFRHVKHCIVAPAPAEASADSPNPRASSFPPARTYKRRRQPAIVQARDTWSGDALPGLPPSGASSPPLATAADEGAPDREGRRTSPASWRERTRDPRSSVPTG